MNERENALKCRSLPPMVEGKVNGYLTMKVDEVVWCRNAQINTVVLVKWWGENKAAVFGPLNVKTGTSGTVKNTTVLYAIKTSINLFEEYLKDCEGLELSVVNHQLHSVVGHVFIRDVLSLVRENIYQCYFPILNSFRNRIGDLHVGFSLQSSHHQISPCVMIHNKSREKKVSEPSRQKAVENESSSLKTRNKAPKHYPECRTIPSSYSLPNLYKSKDSDFIVPDSIISDLLIQGQKLRDAMVKSVLEDGGLELVEKDISDPATESPSVEPLGTWNKNDKETTDEAKVMEFLLGKSMTPQDEDDVVARLKNLSPVASLLEMAEDLAMDEKFVKDQHEAESRIRKMEAEEESSCQFSGAKARKSRNGEEHDIQNAASIKDGAESLQPAPIYHDDLIMQYINSLRITIHSLYLNKIGTKNQSHIQSQMKGSTVHMLHEVPKRCSTAYFVEYELPYQLDPSVKGKKKQIKKNSKPWHNTVKRFCSNKQIGPEIYFEQTSIHMLPITKTPLYSLLNNVNIMFRIYSRQLHQKIPLQIGEAEFKLAKILKSETLGCCEHIEFFCMATIPEHQLCEGVLKVSVDLGLEGKHFGHNFLSLLKPYCYVKAEDINEPNNGASVKRVAVSVAQKALSTTDASHRVQNSTKKLSSKVNKRQTVRKTEHPRPHSQDVCSSSTSDSESNKPVLLHSLLHISDGRDFETVNSYLLCRAFWKDDIITSDICWDTGNPHYNFHQLIPVLLSADLLERSHDNFLITELWERKVSSNCDTLIGYAKLPLNKFYVAYRDPEVVAQLLLSKYPVIAIDGWVTVMNPITQMPCGQIQVVLALGTEDQVQLLEVSRGLKETILTPSQCQDSECRMQYGSDIRPGTSKMAEGQITSTEPSLCSVLNNSDIFIENHNVCESQMRHIRPNSGVARGSLRGNGQSLIIQQQDYDLYADSMFTLGSHEPVRNTVTNSVQESTVLNGNQNGRPRNISGNVNGAQDLYIQPRSRIQKDAYVGKVPMHVNGVQVTSSYQSSILNLELIQQRKDEGTKNNGNSLGHVRQFPQRCQPEINGACKDMSVQNHDSVPHVTHTNKITEQNNLPFINEDSNIIQGENSGSQSNIDQQMTQLQVFENSNEHFDSEMDSHEVLNDRFNAFHPTSQTGYHRKHQESQTDLLILDLADCGSLPLQSSSTFNKRENLPTDPTFDDTCKDCNRVNEMLNRDVSNGDSSNLLHSKLRTKEKSVQFSQQSSDLKINSSEAETNSHANKESEQEISSLTKGNVMTVSDKVLKSGHLLEEPVPLRSADTENYFHVHVEIERAMHLQCFKEQKKNESDTEAEFEPSTYVTFLLKQCCSSSNETDVRVFTPLVPQTVNPVWHWHCDTWLPSDLLTNNGKRLIFKVWQSVDGSSKDPQRDIVLGFATVDLTVLLCGMPWVSGWFNIMDFAGRCAGQIKINVTPLENLNHFIPYIISDNKLMDKECSTHKEEYTSGCICGRNCSDDSMKDNSTMLSSSEANKRICDTHRPTLEKSLRQKPEMSRSKKRGDREASSLKSRKMPDAVVTESLADCETEMQDDMTSSVLAHALKQKLAELDEITQRLKERLHVVTNEDFVAPYLPWLQENEIPIDIQEADDDAYQGSSFKIGSAGSHLNLANGDVYNGGSNVKHTGTSASKEKQTQTHIHKQLQSKLQADTSVRITSDEVSSETHKNHLDKNEGIVGRNAVVKIPNSAENMINRREVIHKPEFQSGYNEKSLRRARTRSPSVEMRQEEGIEEFDKLTDYLMQTSARELELENVFNPLLFQHLLSSCGSVSDCHYRSRYDVENNSDNSTGNTVVTKHQNLKYNNNIKEGNNTYFCGTKELNCNMSKKKEKINYPAYDMECRTELETSNTKFVEIITLPERECDSAISSAKSTQIDPHLEQEERSSGIPEELFVDTEKCKTAVGSSTNSNSEVSFISGSVSELNISNGSVSDETSHQTSVFVLRQAPEGGNTLEEDNTATPVSITADEFNGLSKGEQTERQEQDLTCVKPGASHNKEISNDNSFSSSQMMSQCQKHGLENGNEESAIDLSRMWANRKGTHSLINEEKIRQIAKIFNMNVTSSEV